MTPRMPTGVVLMMTSKLDLAICSRRMVLAFAWRASFFAVSAVRFQTKTSAPFSTRPKTAARPAPPAPRTRTFAPRERQAALERANDRGDVGIEAVELAILRADDGVAGADLLRERVGFCEVLEDFGLEGHGDGEAVQRNFAGEREQIVHARGLQREKDAVDGLAAEGDVVHERRERVAHGIAGDSVDLGGGVDVVDAPGFAQRAGVDLAGTGFFAGMRGGKGEDAAGAQAEHAADDPLLAHGDADDVGLVAAAIEEAHHGDVVGQGLRGRNDLDELGLEGQDAVEDGVEVFGALEIVIADDEGRAVGAELLHLRGLGVLGGLQLDVDEMTAGERRLFRECRARRGWCL